MPPDPRRARLFGIAALSLFAVSLLLPAIRVCPLDGRAPEVWGGLQIALTGWLGLFIGVLGWLANPLFSGCAVMLLLGARPPLWLAGAAMVLGLTLFITFGHSIPLDEGGVRTGTLCGTGAGAFLWLAALAVAFAASVVLRPPPPGRGPT